MVLPDTILGYDTDEILAFSTKKVVWVRDRFIGLLYYSLIFLVFLWVVIGQILWRNEHFLQKDVGGIARIWYTHPTVDGCDPNHAECRSGFRNLNSLGYCDVFDPSAVRPKDAGNPSARPAEKKRKCRFYDKHSLWPVGE